MTYTDQQLSQEEELASYFLPISDIALYIRVDASELRNDIANEDSDVSKSYRRGKLTTRIEIHKQEIDLAKVGSPTALDNARRSLLSMEDDE